MMLARVTHEKRVQNTTASSLSMLSQMTNERTGVNITDEWLTGMVTNEVTDVNTTHDLANKYVMYDILETS